MSDLNQLIISLCLLSTQTQHQIPPLNLYSLTNSTIKMECKESGMKATTHNQTEIPQTAVGRNVAIIVFTHLLGLYGLYLLIRGEIKWQTFVFSAFYGWFAGIGITAGAHRLWAHQSYKAKTPLKLLLMYLFTVAGQESILTWVRDHRVHHKYVETDADPYNAKRGFYFSHIGWLFNEKHEAVMSKLRTIDVADLEADPVVMFQYRYYTPLAVLGTILIPLFLPLVWGETFLNSLLFVGARMSFTYHFTFFVNSVAHMWGFKPYDKSIGPVENKLVAILAAGEGWHNFHHVFPWDYKAAEFGHLGLNFTASFINFFARIGWAYDLKTVSESVVQKRAERTGDGSWNLLKNSKVPLPSSESHGHENSSWGWGDKDTLQEHVKLTQTLYTKGA